MTLPETRAAGVWTCFHDMHSGGGTKEAPFERIYIEAPIEEAKVIFYNRFDHNPERVSCTCCGDDYSISESTSLKLATGYDRNCKALETPRGEDGRFKQPDDPWWHEHYYVEPEEEAEAVERGWTLSKYPWISRNPHRTVEEYEKDPTVLIVRADEIKPEERTGSVPEEGYVWVGG